MKDALENWHAFVKSPNTARLQGLLSDEVVFHSPVVHTPQNGKQITAMYLTAAATVLKGFEYQKEIISNNQAALEFTANVDGIVINGIDIITFNESSEITEFKVMIRPLQAVIKIQEKMGALLAKIRKT